MEGRYEIFISDDFDGILCAKIQSRHISAKKYLLWIRHDDISIKSWFCKCKVGTRVVGMCAHITSVIWFLGLARHEESGVCGVVLLRMLLHSQLMNQKVRKKMKKDVP